MTEAPPPLLRYSPAAAPGAALDFVFVGREPLVDQAVDSARDLQTGHGAAHHLYIGERGMGKTHLVSMIRRRLAETGIDTVALDEEPWTIRDYRSLLGIVLQRRRLAVADDIRDREASLAASAAERPLVLLVENLGEVFGRIGADGRSRLRALLENSRRIALVATAVERPATITRHSEPFFGFFDVTDLQPLDTAEVIELTSRVAEYAGHPDVVVFVTTEDGRRALSVIHRLLGGQPRVWTILAEIASMANLLDPAPLVRRVLDDLLPQYQDRISALPADQQAIVMHLVAAGGARTVRQIAEAVGVDQRSASGQLRHLAGKGWVAAAAPLRVQAGGDRRASFYELRERLVRLCLQLKTGTGVPLETALEYLAGGPGLPEPAGMVRTALTEFGAGRDRSVLLALPVEWRDLVQDRLVAVAG